MITIKTDTVKKCGDYDKVRTTVEIKGCATIIKEEIKTIFLHCKEDEELRHIVIDALDEVIHDN